MQHFKRVTAMLLALVMVLSLLPVSVLAVDLDVGVAEDQELVYFVDSGATAFPTDVQALIDAHTSTVKNPTTPDQTYTAGSWGYTNDAGILETHYGDSGNAYESIRNFESGENGQTLTYRFDGLEQGNYQVAVGLYDPWAQWTSSLRIAQVSVKVNGTQSGEAQSKNYNENWKGGTNVGEKLHVSFSDIAVTENGSLDINIAPTIGTKPSDNFNVDNFDVLVSWIMVTRTKSSLEGAPELPQASDAIYTNDKTSQSFWLDLTCSNKNAVHSSTNKVTAYVSKLTGGVFARYGQIYLDGETFKVDAELEAAPYFVEKWNVEHTVSTAKVTLAYDAEKSCWRTDGGLQRISVDGVCTLVGPALPVIGTNCEGIKVALCDAGGNQKAMQMISTTYPLFIDKVTARTVKKDADDNWTCEVTVNGYKANATEDEAANYPVNYALTLAPDYVLDDSAASKTVTLTYNVSKGKWGTYTGTSFSPNGTVTWTVRNKSTAPGLPTVGEQNLQCYPIKALEITLNCTNENSVHKYSSPYVYKPNWISAEFVKSFSEPYLGDDGLWYCTATVDAAAFMEKQLGAAHTAEDIAVTLYYNETQRAWYIPEDAYAFSMSGACDQTGPEAPTANTCTDFYVSVYEKTGETVKISSLSSTTLKASTPRFTFTFGTPVKGADGVWTCEATVDATELLAYTIAYHTSKHLRYVAGEPLVKTITLTYQNSSGKWTAPHDGYGYTSKGVANRNGVAFLLEPQYTVTFAPGTDATGTSYTLEDYYAEGDEIPLPVELPFTAKAENDVFAGWKVSHKVNGSTVLSFYPAGTSVKMLGQNITLNPYYMTVKIEAATEPYDETKAVSSYTFTDSASFISTDVVLYKITIYGKSGAGQCPYALTLEGGEAVYGTALEGTISKYGTSCVVYVAKAYEGTIPETQTVELGNGASASIPLTVTAYAPDTPTESTNVYGPTGENWGIEMTYVCTNTQSVHKKGASYTGKLNYVQGKDFAEFGRAYLEDGVWKIDAKLNAANLLANVFDKEPHTGENVSVKLKYNEEQKKWCFDVQGDKALLTVTGVCEQNGPAAPSTANCSDFYVTVYKKSGDTVSSLASTRWDTNSKNYWAIEFGTPVMGEDGTWTCEATVTATAYLDYLIGYQESSHLRRVEGESDTKTITLTYKNSSAKWIAAWDGYGTSSKNGAAFLLTPQYEVTFAPGTGGVGSSVVSEIYYANGDTVTVPETVNFTGKNGFVLAGWYTSYGPTNKKTVQVFPVGTDLTMMADTKATFTAYWMKVDLQVAQEAYDAEKAAGDYTFGTSGEFRDGDTVLYKATVTLDNTLKAVRSYALTCDGAEAVYGTSLTGEFNTVTTTKVVYFTKTFVKKTAAETVTLGNGASATVTLETIPATPTAKDLTDFYVTIYGYEPKDAETVQYMSIGSTRLDYIGEKANVTFGEVFRGEDGQWYCPVTVDATTYFNEQLASHASGHYRVDPDEPTVKTVNVVYDEARSRWVSPSDGVPGYGRNTDPTKLTYRNGVAFKLIKQYVITYTTARDLSGAYPTGDKYTSDPYDFGAQVTLPTASGFSTEYGFFAGWKTTVKQNNVSTTYFYPIGTKMTMFGQDVTLEAYWMDVELTVATTPYDASKSPKEYTFDSEVALHCEPGAKLLYRITVKGNSEYPYFLKLSNSAATLVYGSELSGSLAKYTNSLDLYFTMNCNGTTPRSTTVQLKAGKLSKDAVIALADSQELTVNWAHSWDTGVVTKEATCAEAGEMTYTCAICGETKIVSIPKTDKHSYAAQVTKEATCTEEGVMTYTCSVCGGSYTEAIPMIAHDYETVTVAPTCTEAGYTTHTCKVCGHNYMSDPVKATGHDYEVTVVAPTCTEAGYTTHTCKVCGHSFNDSYATPLGHSYAAQVTREATCTEEGVMTYTCSVCGDSYTEAIPMIAHDYETATVAPTCTEAGYTIHTCKVCGHNYMSDPVKATGHDYEVTVVAPTCTEAGYTTHTCKVCGHSFNDSYATPLGHSYAAQVTKEATCTEEGVMTYTCSVCGGSYTEAIPMVAHDYETVTVAPTCMEAGYTTHTCKVCGHSYVDSIVPATGHDYVSVVTAPTCTAAGYTTHTCKVCGHSYVDSIVPATGHKYELVNAKEATCTEAGYTGDLVCAVCGDVKATGEEIPALGHTWGEWETVEEADCFQDGKEQRVCEACKETETRVVEANTDHCPSKAYSDLNIESWYHEGVDYVLHHDIMNGIGGGLFDPEGALTRAQLATILYRAAGSPDVAGLNNPFADVAENMWYTNAIMWAANAGVVKGMSETEYAPDAIITREQIATMLFRYAKATAPATDALASYPDGEKVAPWAEDAMNWAVATGIIKGVTEADGSVYLAPQSSATRAQTATIIYRFLER